MPLNEASPARSNLTRREKREALAAIYGVPVVSEYEAETIRRLISDEEAEPQTFKE